MTTLPLFPETWLLRALQDAHRTERIKDGLRAVIEAHYAEYEDATKLGHEVREAIETICNDGWSSDIDAEELICDTEAALNRGDGHWMQLQPGRVVKTYDDE